MNLFWKKKWEVFYDAGEKSLGIRKIKYIGEIKGIYWGNYKTKQIFSVKCTKEKLLKLAEDIKIMVDYETKRD